uniref:protein-tyrosine-phosphatase n=1 Tax=Pseudictyota dubia TaxID=2749911 RepID=A0A7R9ZF94_9STRA|mmetsp:Transcript_47107/g.87502  ORF Transcript_47107/g.87502 Transcript_47107/m.87502 type:complete len:237 (+) Transcript_47107:196-906(+)
MQSLCYRQSGVPNYFEKDKRLTYKRIPVYDASTSDLLSRADQIVGFISSGLHHGSVLVHCKLGASRSATCVIFFLMRKLGMTFDKAFALCRRRRPDVNPIPAFVTQMRKYEMKCRKMGIISSDEGSELSSKKRKSPAGPSRGPSGQVPATGLSRPVQGPAIGPLLPPDPQMREHSLDEPQLKKKAKKDQYTGGDSIGPAIGPAMGPGIGSISNPPSEDRVCTSENLKAASSNGKEI